MLRLIFVLLLLPCTAFAQETKFTAKLVCGAWSGNPEGNRAFQDDITFGVTDGVLYGERELQRGEGKEIYRGVIAPSGAILLAGTGKRANGGSEWVVEFAGKKNRKDDTLLKGRLVNTKGGVGSRDCTLTF